MPTTEGLDRKKKIRAAHRASATRNVHGAYELVEASEVNLAKLKQVKQTLTEKLKTLADLDAQILELTDEADLESEIEQADSTRERITLCIIDIDGAVDRVAKNVTAPSPLDPAARREHGDEGEHERSTSPSSVRTEDHETPPVDDVPIDDGGSPPSRPPTRMTSEPAVMATPGVKLPKLTIKKFGGDMTKWVSFWDSFESAVDHNPTLTDIDKFNYLKSYLDSTAADAIAGLTLTAANYAEAIATLKRRFGNTQLIVSKHMDGLLGLPAVSSPHDVRSLRQLYDAVESHVRGLRALGVSTESYGGMLTSILMSKLPAAIRLIVNRELTDDTWAIADVLKSVEKEVRIRERAAESGGTDSRTPKKGRSPTTVSSLLNNSSGQVRCSFCNEDHSSQSCTKVAGVDARKESLRKSGRCFVCLRRNHISRTCRSSLKCSTCNGRHHVSICPGSGTRNPPVTAGAENSQVLDASTSTNLSVGARNPILLQTASTTAVNPSDTSARGTIRFILDGGSQRSYITSEAKEKLCLPTEWREKIVIKTFGSNEKSVKECEVVKVGLETKGEGTLQLNALVVPFICDSLTSQPTCESSETYRHLDGLELADPVPTGVTLQVDMLVGSDHYWRIVTGRTRRGTSGPVAIETKMGWVLSGPVAQNPRTMALTVAATHALRVETVALEQSLDNQLRQFWELESLGVAREERSVYEQFEQQISFDGQRYEVSLPWKPNHLPLPDHYELCRKRLLNLLRRLRQDPTLLSNYDAVMKEQLRRGMVEEVLDPKEKSHDRVHYLPHHGVVRQDKTTTKLRIVYDASAKTTGPSLNECLYTGPSFGQSIFDILVRFRYHKVVVAGDIEKAFLMVSMSGEDRDALRFLWIRNVEDEPPEVVVYRFTRVAFGVSSSPFLLNATIRHHIQSYVDQDPEFVNTFLSSIYVDDVSLGEESVSSAYDLYLKSKTRLAEAGFTLRKFVTNSQELREKIESNEGLSEPVTAHSKEEDLSYAKSSLGTSTSETPSRGMSIEELSKSKLWLNGPLWLADVSLRPAGRFQGGSESVPEECLPELKCSSKKNTLSLVVQADPGDISQVIDCGRYSTLHRLLRVTKLVVRFIRLTKERVQRSNGSCEAKSDSSVDLDSARTLLLRASQAQLPNSPKFLSWQHQSDL